MNVPNLNSQDPLKGRVPRVAVVTNVVPSYRASFYQELGKFKDMCVTVYCQDHLPGWNLKLVHGDLDIPVRLVTYLGSERRISWQRLPLRELWLGYDIIVFHGSIRALSTIVWATFSRLLRRDLVIWTQGHTAGAKLEKTRFLWYRMFDNLLLYTQYEADQLRAAGFPATNILGINNGLDQAEIERASQDWPDQRLRMWQQEQGISKRSLLLSVARLDPKNKFPLMLEAMPKIISADPSVLWVVIGDGDAGDRLRQLAASYQLDDHVRWLGPIYAEQELAPWFLSSRLLVHPGAIGLSLLHAFGYGLPVATHSNRANQMPEFAALRDGVNGMLFDENSADSLQRCCTGLLRDDELRERMSVAALSTARNEFNTQIMARRFRQMIRTIWDVQLASRQRSETKR